MNDKLYMKSLKFLSVNVVRAVTFHFSRASHIIVKLVFFFEVKQTFLQLSDLSVR